MGGYPVETNYLLGGGGGLLMFPYPLKVQHAHHDTKEQLSGGLWSRGGGLHTFSLIYFKKGEISAVSMLQSTSVESNADVTKTLLTQTQNELSLLILLKCIFLLNVYFLDYVRC